MAAERVSAAEDFAGWLANELGTNEATTEPLDTGPRAPRPNLAQGTSANGSPEPVDNGQLLGDLVQRTILETDRSMRVRNVSAAEAGRYAGWAQVTG